MTEILFVVSEATNGAFVARGVDASIVVEADDMDQLRVAIRDAVPLRRVRSTEDDSAASRP